MKSRVLGSDILLLITATIWGFAFVAQRVGMDYIGPFTFNGIRFGLGSLSLIPLSWVFRRRGRTTVDGEPAGGISEVIRYGIVAGVVLYAGASLQQVGLVYTTAGKAGFITGLYVVIVPLMWMLLGQKSGMNTWAGAVLATVGLYLLSVTREFTIQFGDLLEIFGAFFWALHVILIARFSRQVHPIHLSMVQFAFCSIFSLITAFTFEVVAIETILQATVPLLYGGFCSVGIAYTLQVVAQRHAHPAHAAILLSLESVTAAVGGWLLLGETLSTRSQIGCALMFGGMLLSQLRRRHRKLSV